MFTSLRPVLLFSLLIANTGCGERAPAPPQIRPGDYQTVIDHLRQQIPEQMRKNHVPGLSVALVDGQEIIWAEGFGMADRELDMRVTANTAFRAGPVSTLLIAGAALQLVEQRQLALDAPLSKALPEFRVRSRFHADARSANQAVTLRRLLSHQAGLPSEHLPRLYSSDPLKYLPKDASGLWLSNPPGSQTAYSNLGYALLGAAIERSAGEPLESRLQTHLLQPLAMEHSGFTGNSDLEPYRARGYQQGKRSLDHEIRDLSANGLWSTPSDLGRFVQMLFAQGRYDEQQLLSRESISEMFQQQNRNNPLDFDCPVGLGVFLGPCGDVRVAPHLRVWQHGGTIGDFAAQVSVLPEPQLAVIVMANADTAEVLVGDLATQALRLMLRARGNALACVEDCEPNLPPLAAAQVPSSVDRERLSGVYATPLGVVRLKDERQRLFAELSGLRVELLRDDDGWLRPQKKLLGWLDLDLGDLVPLQLDVVDVANRQVLAARRHGQVLPLGERVTPKPLSDDWLRSVGRYRLASHNETNPVLDSLNIRLEEGLLIARSRLGGNNQGEFILLPLDAEHAVLAGNGQGLGATLSRRDDGLRVLGYRFVRQPDELATLQF